MSCWPLPGAASRRAADCIESVPGAGVHPDFLALPPPVIVIGMHRSGTSVVAAVLAELGVFMGAFPELSRGIDDRLRSGGYAEAPEFWHLNDRLLRRAGGSWNCIEPFLARRDEPQFAAAALRALQAATHGRLRTGYLEGRSPSNGQAWGWKDPRTSLTLPYWLRLFPGARVLHVRRGPEAVADSLWKRAHRWRESPPAAPPRSLTQRLRAAFEDPDLAARSLLQRAGLRAPQADPCLDRDYCLRLAALYTEECLRYRNQGARYREIRYEDLVREPKRAAADLVAFTGGRAGSAPLERIAALVAPASKPVEECGRERKPGGVRGGPLVPGERHRCQL